VGIFLFFKVMIGADVPGRGSKAVFLQRLWRGLLIPACLANPSPTLVYRAF
jgi:hypothetical protein